MVGPQGPMLLILAGWCMLHAQPMFEGATSIGDEEIKGRPKSVRVERENGSDPSMRLPEEELAFRRDGKLAYRKRFVGGKLVETEKFEYDGRGSRTAVITRDAKNDVVRRQTFRRLDDGSEEEVATAAGQQMSRTVRRFDASGRVIELKSTDAAGLATTMHFDYDREGRPLEARVSNRTVRDLELRVHIDYPGERQAIISVYDGKGDLMVNIETQEDTAGNQLAQMLFEREPQGKPVSSERVERTDSEGNWTVRALFERNPRTQVDEPVGRIYRWIRYY